MPKKILIKGVNWVGDTILTLPALKKIKKIYPDSRLTVLVKKPLSSLFAGVPYVDEVIPYVLRKNLFLKIIDHLSLIKKIKKQKFNTAIVLPNSFAAALLVSFSSISEKIGYKGNFRNILLTKKIKKTTKILERHQVEYYLNIINQLTSETSLNYEVPELIIPETIEQQTNRLIKNNSTPLIGINPGAIYGSAKRWPEKKYITLSNQLLEKNYHLIFFGSSAEEELIANIQKQLSSPIINMAGKTSLIEAACLIKKCKAFISNDSGLMHIASAVKTPIIAIFGPTKEHHTAPLGEHTIIRSNKKLPCVPCMKRECPLKHHDCMESIEVDMVLKELEKTLKV